MIKGFGYLKLLKQLSIILLIGCFGFCLNYSDAGSQTFMVGLDKAESNWDTFYEIGFLPRARFNTMLVGTVKPIVALDDGTFIYWLLNQGLYFYNSFGQGYFQYYKLCSEIGSNAGDNLQNCGTPIKFDLDDDIVYNFLNYVKNGDYVYITYSIDQLGCGGYCTYHRLSVNVCFSSSDIGDTLCFVGDRSDITMDGYRSYYPFTGSYGFTGLTFGSDFFGVSDPPLFNGGSSSGIGSSDMGTTTGNSNSTITGSYVYSSCTYKDIVDYFTLNGDWSKYFCYGGLDNFNYYDSSVNYSPIPGTGKTLNQIVTYSSAWDTPLEWYNFRRGIYLDNNHDYVAMWESYPAVFHTWFDLYYQYGGGRQDFNDVLEFCNIVTNYQSLSGSVYRGHNSHFINSCNNIKNPQNVGSGNYAIGVNRSGIGDRSGNIVTYNNAVNFIQDSFNLLKNNFLTQYGSGYSSLPIYIIIFMCALIFFRFLRH